MLLLGVGFLVVLAIVYLSATRPGTSLIKNWESPRESAPLAASPESVDEQVMSESDREEALLPVLTARGEEPFSMNAKFWNELLRDESKSASLRAAGAEALAMSTPDAMPLLRDVALGSADPEPRAMAAWSLSLLGESAPFGRELAAGIAAEENPDVRRRLYEALLVQEENPAGELFEEIAAETDLAARVAGFNALGNAVARSGEEGISQTFDLHAVPELEEIASSEVPINLRLRAVFALRRASTQASVDALIRISKSTPYQVAAAASNGIQH